MSTQSGAGLGLQIAGMGAGLIGSAVQNSQQKQDRRIANGQEDPAIAALRKRLAAQNAQSAMRVAASQQGVNPALAQRNAQQALAQQQVQTNANLAQANAASTMASRGANRNTQMQRVQGTLGAVAQGALSLGTGLSAQAAYDAAGSTGAVTDAADKAKRMEPGGVTSAPIPASPGIKGEGAVPTPEQVFTSQAQPVPIVEATGTPVPYDPAQAAVMSQVAPQPVAAPAAAVEPVPMGGLGMPQMRGGEAQTTAVAPAIATPAPIATQPMVERQITPAAQANPTVGGAIPATPALDQGGPITQEQLMAALPPSYVNSEEGSLMLSMIEAADDKDQTMISSLLRRSLLNRFQ